MAEQSKAQVVVQEGYCLVVISDGAFACQRESEERFLDFQAWYETKAEADDAAKKIAGTYVCFAYVFPCTCFERRG